ncbi:layilin-like [Nothobranchius furzeri]|uniref:Layilin-like n=1 Tax=Nothobranchius furzeri TaxID=105023 RepID=A0A9D2XNU1_NOTFU|nr:layilin-like [Nothobranchius furzeri]
MDLVIIHCFFQFLCFHLSAAASLITVCVCVISGQRVCKAGKGRPCYKLAYFSELRWKLNFAEAELACRRDGGRLLSIESESEQKVIEQLITELRPSDGDFWLGLRRNHGDEDSSSDCSFQYYWLDGSTSTFRNWHLDEPSCGYEVCVVMYHQPSAPPGQGGLYMFQWNDDNCETKNNFICKYTTETLLDPTLSPNSTQTDAFFPSVQPWGPSDHNRSTVVNLVYVIIPTIPLILLLLTAMGVCCFKLLLRRKRKQHKSEVCQTEPGIGPSPTTPDVYNVIRSQKDDDLVSARPHTKNTSFLCSSPDTPTGDYDNLGGRDTESGFVTLASTESDFLNFDLGELSFGRRGTHDFYDGSLGCPGKRALNDNSLGRPGKRESNDGSLGRPGTRELNDSSLCRPGTRESNDGSLGRPGTRESNYGSLCRPGKRELNDSSLGRSGNREFYDRSMGCRTTKSEHYSSSLYTDHGLYDSSFRPGSDLYDGKLKPGGQTGMVDLYQTYVTSGKHKTFHTTLGTQRKSFHTNLDCYKNGLNLDSGRRYFNEQDWINRESY